MRFVLFVALVAFLGWMFENIIGPWMDLKLLQLRAQREIEQQRKLRQIMGPQCICVWFAPDTLVVNPHCKAFDHGDIAQTTARLSGYLRAYGVKTPYKFRKD